MIKEGQRNEKGMKKRWIAVTAGFAVLILTAGIVLLPAVYSVIFDAESLIQEEEPLPEELYSAAEAFMDRFRYPLLEETQVLPQGDREILMDEGRAHFGDKVYERIFRLVGLEEEDSYWENLAVVKGGSSYLMQVPMEKEGEPCLLSVALSEEQFPYLICLRSGREPSEEEMEQAVRTLLELCETGMGNLRLYTERIDEIYENCQDYQYQKRELYIALLPEEGTLREISEDISLWDCCTLGEWQVCRDERETVLVCVMGQGSLVLYYDAVEKGLCGYRILFENPL